MEQSQSQKQPRIVSSIQIHRKPFSDLTNRRHATQSNKLTPYTVSVVSDSSTRSTQNPNRLTPRTPTPDDWVRVGNRIARSQRNTMLKTRSKTKAATAVPAYSIHLEKTENETKKSKSIMEEDVRTSLSGAEIYDNAKKIVDGAEIAFQSKSSTDPLPNNKRRNCSSTGSSGKYVVSQDFIDQQRAYYKEIDKYELEVEEVEYPSEEEE